MMPERHPALAEFLKRHPETRWIDAFVPDQTGFGYGKRLPMESFDSLFAGGIAMSCSAFALDARHHGHDSEGIGWRDGDPDMVGKPMVETLKPMPWAQVPTAQVMLEAMDSAGAPLWHDPHTILSSIVAKLKGDGLFPVVACELEFYLVDGKRGSDGLFRPPVVARTGEPYAYPVNAASLAGEEMASFLDRLHQAARAQGLPTGAAYVEYGRGQFEITLQHGPDPVKAADEAVLLKRAVRGVARSMGFDATFMAKPYAGEAASGFHLHMSLTDAEGHNLFARDAETMRHAVGGMRAMLGETLLMFTPNANAFKRAGALFAPVNLAWGFDNRTVAFRIPAGPESARRIEHRAASADANPYLVMAAVLAAAHHGITHRIDPGKPASGHAGFDKDHDLPADVYAAARALEKGKLIRAYLPPRYQKLFAALKRGEHEEFLEAISARELEFFA